MTMTMSHFSSFSPDTQSVQQFSGAPGTCGAQVQGSKGGLHLRQGPEVERNEARRRLTQDRRHLPLLFSPSDIIPVFYLSPCNSFYISGLCSLAPVQSQPRDTGLYQQPPQPPPRVCVLRSS